MSRREKLLEKIRTSGSGPKRSLGQNFLVSDQVIERIVANATDTGSTLFWSTSEKPTMLLEIGPGLGALTDGLIEFTTAQKLPFAVIELDSDFAENWRSAGLKVHEGDALQIDWSSLGIQPGTRLISNLPYQISSSIVIDRSVETFGITSMVLMFQKEVAKRIAAKPGTEDYGLLTVIAQLGWVIETVCDAGPQDFFPAPRVVSRVLRFRRRTDAPDVGEFGEVLRFAKTAYGHRRKLVASNLSGLNWGAKKAPLARPAIETTLEALGFTKTARAEELSPEQLLELSRRLR